MSWQAVEAVMDHSKLTSEQSTGYLVLLAIARHCNQSGVAGWGGKKTSPSMFRIAESARCTKQTVLNWLPKLEATGELSIERNGKGRGRWNKYVINLPMATNGQRDLVNDIGQTDLPNGIGQSDRPIDVDNGQPDLPNDQRIGKSHESIGQPDLPNDQRIGKSHESIGQRDLPNEIDQLTVLVNDLALLVKGMVNIGKPQALPDTDLDTDLKDTKREEEEEAPPHIQAFNAQNQIEPVPEIQEPSADPILEAICEVTVASSRKMTDTSRQKLLDVVDKLRDCGHTPEQIRTGFGLQGNNYWYTASFGRKDNQLPSAGNILNEIDRAIAWKPQVKPTNGHSAQSATMQRLQARMT